MDHNTFDSIKIGLASPDMIRSWSYGEVKKPETINYRTLKAERDGLFCERIFGPTKDWECLCGKYKRVKFKGKICEKCGVEVTTKKVRRERMGHIELAAPVSHIWYFRAIPSRMGLLLDITPRVLEKVLYFASYIVIDPGVNTGLTKYQALTDREYRDAYDKYQDNFRVGMGAEAIKELLAELDIPALATQLHEELATATGQKKLKIIKRLEVVEAFNQSNNKPEWMILDVIPVIPPDLRPMVQLDGGRFASSDLNDLYRRVINRNNRLKRLLELHAPQIIIRNEKRMLQEAVDALIDNGRRGKPVTGPNNRPLKSLSEMLRGKQGRFRQNLLGKRVDYSGRSVIVVGPELKLYQCGLPKEMAIELFKPFVMKRLVETGKSANIKDAKKKVDRVDDCVWDALETVIKEHPVLLNRAPTLHRLSIQAFEPILVDGKAIKLHPLVCPAFNADFDGDQMPVHVPLSSEAQAEARFLMLSVNNLLKPVDGHAIVIPSQDVVLGSYYLTIERSGELGEGHYFRDFNEAVMAHDAHLLGLHARIHIRVTQDINTERPSSCVGSERTVTFKDTKIIETTLGRLIFNRNIPQDLEYVPRTPAQLDKHIEEFKEEHRHLNEEDFQKEAEAFRKKNPDCTAEDVEADRREFEKKYNDEKTPWTAESVAEERRKCMEHNCNLEVDFPVTKKKLTDIVDRAIKYHKTAEVVTMLDGIKATGYKYSTLSSISISVADMTIPKEKYTIVADSEKKVDRVGAMYQRGLFTDDERYKHVLDIWDQAKKDVEHAMTTNFDPYNPIRMMSDSGARGNKTQMTQLAGMRGLMFSATGKTMELPIKSNFREGLKILEYFLAARGARKTLSDTALKTSDLGYLTRRLVDVSQDVIVREEDCHTTNGMVVEEIKDGSTTIEPLKDRLLGRFIVGDVVDPKTGEVLAQDNTMLTEQEVNRIIDAGIKQVKIRSILTCQCRHGVCAHCYGADLAHGNPVVNIGEAVGIIAAESIGEPGTQLTLRNFHTGGVAGTEDITQGLPRVEELFEARRPKKTAVIASVDGTVQIEDNKRSKTVVIVPDDGAAAAVGAAPSTSRGSKNSDRDGAAAISGSQSIPISNGINLVVKNGDHVVKGQALTEGSKYPGDIVSVFGSLDEAYKYILSEVQRVYRSQSIDINDKHIEVITRQMTRKTKVDEPGSTTLLTGTLVDITELEAQNEEIQNRIDAAKAALSEDADGTRQLTAEEREACAEESQLKLATGLPVLLGITKAALLTESFLSAASFQETTKVLTEAAIKGKVDHLLGLKENVIIGKLIPAGTGMELYRNIEVEKVDKPAETFDDDADPDTASAVPVSAAHPN